MAHVTLFWALMVVRGVEGGKGGHPADLGCVGMHSALSRNLSAAWPVGSVVLAHRISQCCLLS